jgi:alpha-glucosidase
VPLPWEQGNQSNGFSSSGKTWLPQPESYQALARSAQADLPDSTLNFYKNALKLRSELKLGEGSFDWVSTSDELMYENGQILVVHNFSNQPVLLPEGRVLLSSMPISADGLLQPNDTAWVLP